MKMKKSLKISNKFLDKLLEDAEEEEVEEEEEVWKCDLLLTCQLVVVAVWAVWAWVMVLCLWRVRVRVLLCLATSSQRDLLSHSKDLSLPPLQPLLLLLLKWSEDLTMIQIMWIWETFTIQRMMKVHLVPPDETL